jgi:hypothetical protein
MKRYKYHHNILTFLKKKFDEFDSTGETSECCFSSFEIAKEFNISEVVSERILFDLKECDCVNFSKYHGFKISENGIKKQLTGFFKYKHKEYMLNKFKEVISLIVSILAIITFFLTVYLKQSEKYVIHIKDIELPKYQSNNTSIKASHQKNHLTKTTIDSLQ